MKVITIVLCIGFNAGCSSPQEMVRVSDDAVFEEINDVAGREFGCVAHLRTGDAITFFGIKPQGDSLCFKLEEGERMVARNHLSHIVSRQYGSAALKMGAVGSVIGAGGAVIIGVIAIVTLSPIRDNDSNVNWVEGSLKLGGIGALVGGVSGLALGAIFGEQKLYWFNEK